MPYTILDFGQMINGYQIVQVLKDGNLMLMVDDGEKNNFFETGREAVDYIKTLKRG